MLQVHWLDPSDPLSVVVDLGNWSDQGVKDHIPIVVDDRDPSKALAVLSQNALAVEGQNFGFPDMNETNNLTFLSCFPD
jgi:hypothetical protein